MTKLRRARLPAYHRPSAWGTVRAYDDESGRNTAVPGATATAWINNLPSAASAQVAQAHQDALYRIAIATAAGTLGGTSFIASAASNCIPCHR